jgi:LPS sulfotransferase NodH
LRKADLRRRGSGRASEQFKACYAARGGALRALKITFLDFMDSASKTFDERLHALFEQLRNVAEHSQPPRRKVAIISTPRCGSKFFCESLASTRRFGHPAEWMNPSYLNAYARVLNPTNLSLSEYFNFIIGRTTSPNGVFSLNFHVDQFMYWQKRGIDLLSLRFDRIYHLHRRNKFAQALSFAKANHTGQWRFTDKLTRHVPAGEITNSMIIGALHQLSLWDEFYESHLARFVHRSYCYEEYLGDRKYFYDVLDDCEVERQDIVDFSCAVSIQRVDSDRTIVSRLENYLGCEISDA